MKRILYFALALIILACNTTPTVAPTPSSGSTLTPGETRPPTLAPTSTALAPLLPTGEKPNIILILTDDQDAASAAFMPQVKALLADKGLTFTNAFVTTSLCCPSRASILRGQYAHNHQVLANDPPDGGFGQFYKLGHEESTIAVWLQSAGYTTALFGKYLNQYPSEDMPNYVPPGWSEWYGASPGYFNYTLNENGTVVQYGADPEDYQTDVLASKAVDFIQRMAQTDEPFFAYIAPKAPHSTNEHDPPLPAPRHENEFPGITAPRSPSFNEEDVRDKSKEERKKKPLTEEEIASIDELYRRRLQSLLAVDELVAQVVDALKTADELDRTYIIFMSDNGYHLGQHRIAEGKGTPYEESIRVPFIVFGPGIPEGETRDHLVLNIDLAPTIAQLGGAAIPEFSDGRSLILLLGRSPAPPDEWRQAFLVEYWKSPQGVPASLAYQAIRTTDTIYIEYTSGATELYDVKNDPYELENVLAKGAPLLQTQLSGWLDDLRNCEAQTCRDAESIPAQLSATALPYSALAFKLLPVVDGLDQPVGLANPGDGSGRLFALEKAGQIRVIENGSLLAEPFLDLTSLIGIEDSDEQGLLGLAFHPDYERNGYFWVDYTDRRGNVVVARYSVSGDPNVANPATGEVTLLIQKAKPIHNGGQLQFGPDGYLYIGVGDGGPEKDNTGQRLDTLLGKILRIDVNSIIDPYLIPPDNPFKDQPSANPTLWAYGLRNPWRFSFDRLTGDMYIADVGKREYEEINFQPANSPGGQNYGWIIFEGLHPYEGDPVEGLTMPVFELSHSGGYCAIIGGYVYRGAALAALDGRYLFGDYCAGEIFALSRTSSGPRGAELLVSTDFRITAFGEDEQGEIYVVDYENGALYQLISGP